MKGSLKLSFQKGDCFVIAGVLILGIAAVGFWGMGNAASKAEIIQIFQNSELIMECSLYADEAISVEGEYHNIVEISGGKVAITESDCPGEDCVHSGWISRSGRSIVCLPNKVEVRIVGQSKDVDFVVR